MLEADQVTSPVHISERKYWEIPVTVLWALIEHSFKLEEKEVVRDGYKGLMTVKYEEKGSAPVD